MKPLLLPWILALFAAASARAADVLVLCYHDVRDEVEGSPVQVLPDVGRFPQVTPGIAAHLDADQYATSTRNLAANFDWLSAHGYHVISLQQLMDARNGHAALPDKAVLLTFDDGLRSSYTKVFPLLKVYHYPAVMAVVGAWVDLAANGKVDFGPRLYTRDDFVTWEQLREMQDSGLVEVASHTYDLHRGIFANPQGNQIPAVLIPAYDAQTKRYETTDEYTLRIRADLVHSVEEIHAQLGRRPRAVMWPYGGYTGMSDAIAASLGMSVSFTLGLPVTFPDRPFGNAGLQAIPRMVLMSNPTAQNLAWSIQHPVLKSDIRAVQVDLDYIYDADPIQQERNLGMLLDRIKTLGVTQVWLQAFADPGGSNAAAAVYFPNRHLPMRADLFSRVAWQLRTRCGVEVYAWLPVLAWQLPDAAMQARLQIQPRSGMQAEAPVRLNPFLPETRTVVGDLYEDLARTAPIAGLLFNDDAVLRDTDDLGARVPSAGPERTRALIAFTNDLQTRVQRWRPQVATARNLFAEPVLHPQSESWYAQSLPAFLSAYNEVALMAMPALENSKAPDSWLRKLAQEVGSVPGGLNRTVFELQTVDWRTRKPIATSKLTRQMQLLQSKGVLHLAYYPDDLKKNNPDIGKLIPAFSSSDHPAAQP
jgi:poly-beta-1,6-N-acetyl-D-glucosamine N-deacetylase